MAEIIYKNLSDEKPPLGKIVIVKRADGVTKRCYLEVAYIDNATFETIYLWKFEKIFNWEWAWYTDDSDEWSEDIEPEVPEND